jgi:FAD/FMN-containing dehydrogenase
MTNGRYESWGRFPKADQRVLPLTWRDQPLPSVQETGHTLLPFGNGRSYGDVCLNDGNTLLDCRPLDRFIAFDPSTGVLRCEAGVLLSEILAVVVPRGWFLPVTPGTQFITLGGAIANDVHGKNHHAGGTFGRHVLALELLRSDGSRTLCSPTQNTPLFAATIAGLGLTGVITWAEIQLKPIASAAIDEDIIRYPDLDAFFELSKESDKDYEYTVAWVDCLARGKSIGRGLFMRGNHAPEKRGESAAKGLHGQLPFPVDPPFALVNGLTVRLFNALYYRKQLRDKVTRRVPYAPFFYPLDAVRDWNRIYGSKGLLQYQCAIPPENAADGIREILGRIAAARAGSFLAVLKVFGDQPSPGLLSFPRPGATLALDFPNQGPRTHKLLAALDEVTRAAEGRIYPAKDALVSAEHFQHYYPQWRELEAFMDPAFSSSFWRRVTGKSE